MELKELEMKHKAACEKADKYAKTVEKHRAKVQKLTVKVEESGDCDSTYDLKWAREDLRNAEWKLASLQSTCRSWYDKIVKERERIRQYAECVPEVMHTFCANMVEVWDKYDKAARDRSREGLNKFYAVDRKMCELRNKRMTDTDEYKALESETFKLRLDYGGHTSRKGYMQIWSWVEKIRTESKVTDEEIHAANVKTAEDLVRDLYFRVADITGTIESWSGLVLAPNGRGLDGIVTGKEGTCKVQTIGAGGYNIQRFHFRCLTHKVG